MKIEDKVLEALRAVQRTGLLSDKPNMPYYKEHIANQIMDTVREILATRTPIYWELGAGSINTLYLKWRQGCQYVNDNFSDEEKSLLAQVAAGKIERVGLKIYPKTAAAVKSNENAGDWKIPLIEYLEQADPGARPFERIGLLLTPEDIDWIHNTIKPIATDFVIEVTGDKLVVVRV